MFHDLFKTQERTFKSFVELVVTSLTSRIDELVKVVATLKASLEFSQGALLIKSNISN